MKAAVLVFLGGGLGSVVRYLLTRMMSSPHLTFPWGTLTVNIAGSFLLGVILGCSLKQTGMHQNTVLFLATGFCGGFTTFSTFALENQAYLKAGDYLNFILYTSGSLVLGILAVGVGLVVSKLL